MVSPNHITVHLINGKDAFGQPRREIMVRLNSDKPLTEADAIQALISSGINVKRLHEGLTETSFKVDQALEGKQTSFFITQGLPPPPPKPVKPKVITPPAPAEEVGDNGPQE
jgi:hypothetical protein